MMSSINKSAILIVFLLFVTRKPANAIGYDVYDKTPDKSRFTEEIGLFYASDSLKAASNYVMKFLGNTGKHYNVVTAIMEPFGGPNIVANTVNSTISINSNYIQFYPAGQDVKYEFNGIMYHESTHVWQWTGNGEAPRGLITGIADYMRLTAGWPSPQWVESRGSGDSWDYGYVVTAFFLEFCSDLRPGFVSELNGLMKDHYSDDFFVQLLGHSVNDLWLAYKASYETPQVPAPSPGL